MTNVWITVSHALLHLIAKLAEEVMFTIQQNYPVSNVLEDALTVKLIRSTNAKNVLKDMKLFTSKIMLQ